MKNFADSVAGDERLHICLYGIDKYKAETRRMGSIPEKTLLTFTWLLGGVGALAGMRVFHHKTRHRAFAVSAPLAAVISIAAGIWLLMM